MPKDEWTDNDLEEMKRIAEKSRPHSPYFDNIHGYQDLAEIEKVKDWALEMEKHGYSICKIRPNLDAAGNQDDPPDALIEMDGQLVGIEVTDLMEYVSENLIRVVGQGKGTVLKWKLRRGEPVFSWCGSTLDKDEKNRLEDEVRANHRKFEGTSVQWTLELFQNRLREIVTKKNKQASSKKSKRVREQGEQALEFRLHRRVLLIFTPEVYLQDCLAEYLEKTELSRPENFDRVFVMGDYHPDGGSGHHPVFEVCLSS